MPKVSVIMPVYHMAKHVSVLKAAVESIKNQTYSDWELLICDDGSPDQTVQVLRQLIGTDTRIRLICTHKNHGAGYARNLCFRASAGEYVAVMDADDISHPQRLEKQAAFLTKNPQYALVGCNALLVDSNGVWGMRVLEEKPDKESFLHTLPFVHPSIMLRREVVEKLHGYAQTRYTRRTEDYEFLMRLYASGYKGYNIQEPLLSYREDLQTYQRWKYRCRIEESRVRCQGFLRLGILGGNFRYVVKPLIAGLIPSSILRLWRRRRYRLVQDQGAGSISDADCVKSKAIQTQKLGGQAARPKTMDQEIPIVLAANQAFVPVLYTCLQSLVNCTDSAGKYHIYIFYTKISKADMHIFRKGLTARNIKIDFVDVRDRMSEYRLHAKEHITTETFYRFLILELFADHKKVVYLDADTIVCQDIAKLYHQEIGDSLLAASVDPDFAGQCHGANPDTRQYCEKVLHLKDPYQYAQAGVLVFHIPALRETVRVPKMFDMAQTGIYRYSDQDILNIVCQGRIKKLAMSWNVLADSGERRHNAIRQAPADILEEYVQARKHPYIIHYAGACKPWQDPRTDFAKEFWQTARQTPYYEELLYRMSKEQKQRMQKRTAKKIAGICTNAVKKVLPQDSRIRRLIISLYWRQK